MRLTESEYTTIIRRQQRPERAQRLPAPTEQAEQEMVVQWARAMRSYMPALEWLFHVPNGGHRDPATANMLKAAGVQPGVPDLFLPVPMPSHDGGTWYGLWIELKRADHSNHPTAKQKRWLDHLRDSGYLVAVCYGATEAIDALEHYLGDRDATTGHGDGQGGKDRNRP